MMKLRSRLLKRVLLGILAVAFVVFVLPHCYRTALGWWRGEPFYKGKPASYWDGELDNWCIIQLDGIPDDGLMMRIPQWKANLYDHDSLSGQWGSLIAVVDWLCPNAYEKPPWIDDPAAIPVLLFLESHSNHLGTRSIAGQVILHLREKSKQDTP